MNNYKKMKKPLSKQEDLILDVAEEYDYLIRIKQYD